MYRLKILERYNYKTKSDSFQAFAWKAVCFNKQIVYINKIKKMQQDTYQAIDLAVFESDNLLKLQPIKAINAAVKIIVKSIYHSRIFYERALGLSVAKEADNFVNLGGTISLSEEKIKSNNNQVRESKIGNGQPSTVFVEVESADTAYENIQLINMSIIKKLFASDKYKIFICNDPDGNIVEVIEKLA